MSGEFLDEFNYAVECVKDVGKLISSTFRSPKTVTEKSGYNDLVTETDQLVEETLKQSLRTKFPEYRYDQC